jgi:hypothetical protein
MRGSYFSSHNVRQLPILAFVASVPSTKRKFCYRRRSNVVNTMSKHIVTSYTLMETWAIKIFWFPFFWARICTRRSRLLGKLTWEEENEWVWIFICRLLNLSSRKDIYLTCKRDIFFRSMFLKPSLTIKIHIIGWSTDSLYCKGRWEVVTVF